MSQTVLSLLTQRYLNVILPAMFYDGDLKSGIALALRDSKYVACFVRGEDEQSSLWEDDYLRDDQIEFALTTKAVTLRIKAGSLEAGYLAAYYPVPVVPAFLVIHNGQLLLDLRAGEAKDLFKAAVLKTMINTSSLTPAPSTPSSSTNAAPTPALSVLEQGTNPAETVSSIASATTATPNAARPNAPPPTSPGNQPLSNPLTAQSQAPPPVSTANQPSQAVQNLLADRRRKLESDKKEKEAAENADRKAKADARQAAILSDPNSAKGKQATYAAQQRKRQQEAKLERDRILQQIEHDKAERKEKEEQRKALARAEAEEKDDSALADEQLKNEINRSKPTRSKECAIQVRMFDGSNIRHKFSSDATLRTDVRAWIDKERLDGDIPYTFKQILTPLPNRTLSISDEEESLQSLGLTPSATLIMVPVQGYTAAYDHQGLVSRGASTGYSVIAGGAGMITGALRTVLGLGQATGQTNEPQENPAVGATESETRGAGSNINIRTLRDQREGRDGHQLYNGNQLNFEPRRDSEDNED